MTINLCSWHLQKISESNFDIFSIEIGFHILYQYNKLKYDTTMNHIFYTFFMISMSFSGHKREEMSLSLMWSLTEYRFPKNIIFFPLLVHYCYHTFCGSCPSQVWMTLVSVKSGTVLGVNHLRGFHTHTNLLTLFMWWTHM